MLAYRKKVGPDAYREWKEALEAKIKANFPDGAQRLKYKLYHELNASSEYEDHAPEFDFPGECSIQKAIEQLGDQ